MLSHSAHQYTNGHAHTCSQLTAKWIYIASENARRRVCLADWLAAAAVSFTDCVHIRVCVCVCVECCARCCYYDSRNTITIQHIAHTNRLMYNTFFFSPIARCFYILDRSRMSSIVALPSLTVRTILAECVRCGCYYYCYYLLNFEENELHKAIVVSTHTQRAHTHMRHRVCIWIIKRLQYGLRQTQYIRK